MTSSETSAETTSELIRLILSWLATYAVHSSLFLGGAWALCRWLSAGAPRTRERIWKLGLIGGLLSATLQLALGARPWLGCIEWTGAPGSVIHSTEESPAGSTGATRQEAPSTDRRTVPPARPETSAARRPRSAPDASSPEPRVALGNEPSQATDTTPASGSGDTSPSSARLEPSPTEPPRLRRWVSALTGKARAAARAWPGLVLAGWCSAGLAGLLCLGASWTCLRRRMLGRRVLRSGPLVEILEELRLHAGVHARVRLSVSPRIRSPFSTGLLRPEICVPSAVPTDLSRAQQEVLLAHELAHLVRRDPAWFGASLLIEKLLFFQPLNRLARTEISELAELACDDWAVRWTGGRLALASCLTEVAGWLLAEPRRALALPGLAGHRSRLGRRIQRLLDDRRSPAREGRAPWWPPLVLVALGLAVMAVPGVSAGAARLQEPASVPRPEASPASVSLPAPDSLPAAPDPVNPLDAERAVLEQELLQLQAEIDELRGELALRALDTRLAQALARIDARMLELGEQHRRVRALLVELANPNTLSAPPSSVPIEPREER